MTIDRWHTGKKRIPTVLRTSVQEQEAHKDKQMATVRSRIKFLVLLLLPVLSLTLLLIYLPPLNQTDHLRDFNRPYTSFKHGQVQHSSFPIPLRPEPNITIDASSITEITSRPKKKDGQLGRIEDGLARARAAIHEAARSRNYSLDKQEEGFIPRGRIYRNPYAFHQSHKEMVKRFKIWVYREGEAPLVHGGPVNNIYGIEGQFIDELESRKSHFIARHPEKAHAFFLPISVAYIMHFIYKPRVTFSPDQLQRLVEDYVGIVAKKHYYWNRSQGADHFLVSCHDWGPNISRANPELYKNFIRVLCNANTSEGFHPERDVSIPEIKLPVGKLGVPGKGLPTSKRSILAFFAGRPNGRIRKFLLKLWKGKDNEVQVHGYLDNKDDYFKLMGRSKFCLCPSGWEVASPRVVEAIQLGCVPVTISDNYILPFSDVLDWSSFSVHIPSVKIPYIKAILKGISDKEYVRIQRRVTQVRRHFLLNRPSQPYDMIHMILHSVWLRRLNVELPY